MSDEEAKQGAEISERKQKPANPKSNLANIALTEVATASPKILLAIMALIALLFLRGPIAGFLNRSTEIGLGPVTLKTAEAKLEQAKLPETGEKGVFSPEQIKTLTGRYSQALAGGRRAGILWVDDNPSNNKDLVDFLDLVGVSVVIARSSPEALARLEERSFNAVISDWSRPDDAMEIAAKARGDQFWGSGAQLANFLAKNGCGRKVILFSSGSTDDMLIAPGVAGQTNNYYDLLLMVADKIRDQTQRCDFDGRAVEAGGAFSELANEAAP